MIEINRLLQPLLTDLKALMAILFLLKSLFQGSEVELFSLGDFIGYGSSFPLDHFMLYMPNFLETDSLVTKFVEYQCTCFQYTFALRDYKYLQCFDY